MNTIRTSVLLAGLLLGTAGVGVQAQDDDALTRIITKPNGAMVYLDGEYRLAGRAPYSLVHALSGTYKIKATMPGYENYETTYNFNQGRPRKLAIKLTKKTRFRAMMRSMFFPGWGQHYSDLRKKGFFIGVLQLAAVAQIVKADSEYQKAVTAYNTAVQNFQANGNSAATRDELLREVSVAQARVDENFETRRKTILIAASVYVYNLLDALIFFPSYHKTGLGVAVGMTGDSANQTVMTLGLRMKF
ncbi:MAG TPA: PEGA domain-containing protein [Bacteroidetes bacterium]|nr:PEGA domain-containing protein [Bacteroidota bacterium]